MFEYLLSSLNFLRIVCNMFDDRSLMFIFNSMIISLGNRERERERKGSHQIIELVTSSSIEDYLRKYSMKYFCLIHVTRLSFELKKFVELDRLILSVFRSLSHYENGDECLLIFCIFSVLSFFILNLLTIFTSLI